MRYAVNFLPAGLPERTVRALQGSPVNDAGEPGVGRTVVVIDPKTGEPVNRAARRFLASIKRKASS